MNETITEALLQAVFDHPHDAERIVAWARANPDELSALGDGHAAALTESAPPHPGLVLVAHTDADGVTRHRWVKPEEVPTAEPQAEPTQPDKPTDAHDPPEAGNLEVEAKAKKDGKFKTALGKVHGAVTKVVDDLVALFGTHSQDILLEANDFAKLSAAKHADPIMGTLGISANDAALIASHVLSRAWLYAKKKLGLMEAEQPAPSDADRAEAIRRLLKAIHEALGIPDAPLPTDDEIAQRRAGGAPPEPQPEPPAPAVEQAPPRMKRVQEVIRDAEGFVARIAEWDEPITDAETAPQ